MIRYQKQEKQMRSFSQRSCETDSRTTLGERPFQKTYAKNNVHINLDEGRLWGSLPTFIIRRMGLPRFPSDSWTCTAPPSHRPSIDTRLSRPISAAWSWESRERTLSPHRMMIPIASVLRYPKGPFG